MELRLARQIARLTQAELAQKAGVDTASISRLETGRRSRRPSYETMVRIARALNVSPEDLWPVPPLAEAPAVLTAVRPRRRSLITAATE